MVAFATYFYNISKFNEYIRELAIGAVFGIKQGFFLVLIAVSSRIFLKEKHSWIKCLLTITCFVGVVLVTLASVLPSYHHTNNGTTTDLANKDSFVPFLGHSNITNSFGNIGLYLKPNNISGNDVKTRNKNDEMINHQYTGILQPMIIWRLKTVKIVKKKMNHQCTEY